MVAWVSALPPLSVTCSCTVYDRLSAWRVPVAQSPRTGSSAHRPTWWFAGAGNGPHARIMASTKALQVSITGRRYARGFLGFIAGAPFHIHPRSLCPKARRSAPNAVSPGALAVPGESSMFPWSVLLLYHTMLQRFMNRERARHGHGHRSQPYGPRSASGWAGRLTGAVLPAYNARK